MNQPQQQAQTTNNRFNYYETYALVTEGYTDGDVHTINLIALAAIRNHLEGLRNQAAVGASIAQENLNKQITYAKLHGERHRSPKDPNVAKFRLVAELYNDALEAAKWMYQCATRPMSPLFDERRWTALADHQVFLAPWLGEYSLIDLIHLTQGTHTASHGLINLDFSAYAWMWPALDGWHLMLNKEDLPITAECAHNLLSHGAYAQEVPFSNECVFPSLSNRPTYNGYSTVVPKGLVIETREQREDNLIDLLQDTRITLYRDHYASLLWSVSGSRYDDTQGAYKEYSAVTAQCFNGNANHIPQDLVEVTFWHEHTYMATLSEAGKAELFQPGWHLHGYTNYDLSDLTQYRVVYTRKMSDLAHEAEEKRLARTAKAAANVAEQTKRNVSHYCDLDAPIPF